MDNLAGKSSGLVAGLAELKVAEVFEGKPHLQPLLNRKKSLV